MRPVILRMAALAERLPALPFEIQGGRVHEHDGEIAQQIAPPLEQPLLDQILDATGNERAIGLIRGRKLLAEPSHGAVEMMEIELLDAVDAVIVASVFAGAVGARHDQPM